MARSTRKAPTTTDRLATTVKPMDKAGLGDLGSRQLRGLGSKAGNQALDAKLQDQAGMRDQLLQFVGQRLKTMHTVQSHEKLEMKHEREWFRAVAKGSAGFHLPDPTRWHEAAHLYERATHALCNGNLGHGASLLDRALEAERAAFASTPRMVEKHLDHTNDHAADAPVELAHVGTESTCPSCAPPAHLRYADLILNVQDKMEQPPPIGRRKGNAWWLEEDEDEDQEDEDD